MNNPKVALVFGGSGGIGQAIIKDLLKQDVKVYVAGRSNPVKEAISCSSTNNCVFLSCDVLDEDSVSSAVQAVLQNESRIDILVNAVTSRLKLKTIDALSMEEYREDLAVILIGGIVVCKKVLEEMKRRGSGVIIHILTSAIVGDLPPRMSSYLTAKAGLNTFLKTLADEVKQSGIRVVGVFPSFVETTLLNAFPSKLLELERKKQAGGILLQPEDVAGVVSNIAANPVRYPNGKNVILNSRTDAQENAYPVV